MICLFKTLKQKDTLKLKIWEISFSIIMNFLYNLKRLAKSSIKICKKKNNNIIFNKFKIQGLQLLTLIQLVITIASIEFIKV